MIEHIYFLIAVAKVRQAERCRRTKSRVKRTHPDLPPDCRAVRDVSSLVPEVGIEPTRAKLTRV
jgi:hypothetical protein